MPDKVKPEEHSALTERQEAFAQAVAKGLSLVKAVEAGGFAKNGAAANRLATMPKIKARIDELRKEMREETQGFLDAKRHADAVTLAQDGVTTKWILEQAQQLFDKSKDEGDHKEALNTLKFIADVVGVTGKNRDPADPNRGQAARNYDPNDPNAPRTINIQVLNKITDGLDRAARAESEAPAALTVLEGEVSDPVVRDERPFPAFESIVSRAGQDD